MLNSSCKQQVNPMPITPHFPKQQGVKPHDTPVSVWHRDIGSLFNAGYIHKIPYKELSIFSRKLSFLLGSGIPIVTALAIVSEQLPGRILRRLIPGLAAKVEQGESFSGALRAARAFPDFFCGFVAIGESTATLPQVTQQLADLYDDRAQSRDELTAALAYPIIVSIMMLGVIILAITFVLPGYSSIFAATDTPLPTLTYGLIRFSNFIINNSALVIVSLAVLPVAMYMFLQSGYGREMLATIELFMPFARLGVNFRLTQALSLLLSAGLPVSQALPFTEDIMNNVHVKRDISKISAQMGAGKPFWENLRQVKYIDPLLVGMVRVGEETGSLPATMEKSQAFYSREYRQALRRLNKLVEPIITLVLGVGLGVIMLAVILPTFELATVI